LSILLVSVLALSSATLFGQSSTGNIEGIVSDASGAVVPNATITITNKATGASRDVTANASGAYTAAALSAGDYELKASVTGFRTVIQAATVTPGGDAQVNITLTVGQATEVVNVEASAAQVNYESNTIQGDIDRAAVADLPLNGRSFMQLAVLEPGVTIASGSTAQFNALFTVSVLGAGNRTLFTADGGNITDNIDTGGGSAAINLPQDVIQEFQLSSVNFDLGTGIAIGGSINIVTRSGSNDFHGSAYFYYRDHNMSAYPGLARQTLDPSPFFARRNPGFTLGGPIKKDKLFFFFNVEHTNQVQAILVQPVGATPQSVAAFAGAFDSPYNGTQYTTRIDYHISSKENFFARYSHDGNSGFGEVFSPNANPSNWVRNINWADQSIIGLTSSFTPTIVNDARIQYQYWSNHNLLSLPSDCVDPTCLGGGLPGLLAVIGTNLGYGQDAIGANPNAPQTRNTRRYEANDTLTWQRGAHRIRFGGQANRVFSVGQWGFCTPYCEGVWGPGADPYLPAGSYPSVITKTSDIYNLPFYSLSTGIFTGIGVGPSNQPPPYLRNQTDSENQYRLFAQDTWKFRPNLTINYGLAWNAQTGFYTQLPESPFLGPILGANNLGKTPNNTKEFSPAIGFAYSPGKGGKTVIRGGAGIYWDGVPGYYHNRTPAANGPVGDGRSTLSTQAFVIPPGMAGISFNFVPAPAGTPIPVGAITNMTLGQFNTIYNDQIASITAKLSPTPPTSGPFTTTGIDISKSAIEIFPPSYPIARSYQTSIGVQRDLGWGMILTADYAMRRGVNLSQADLDYNLNSRYINGVQSPVIPACTNAQLFVAGQECSSGAITFWTAEGLSRYNGLLMKLQKRLSHNLQFTVSYQLAEQRADTSPQDLLNYEASYGQTIPKQTLNLAGTYKLPWGFLLSSNMSFIGPSPVYPTIASLYLPGTAPTGSSSPLPGLPYGCLNVSCGQSQLVAAVNAFNTTYANTKNAQGVVIPALTLPTNYSLNGNRVITQDFSLQKTFSYKERYKLMIIGQMFNAFNVQNLGGYSYNLSSPSTFGVATSRAAQTFGSAGPRAVQIAARLNF